MDEQLIDRLRVVVSVALAMVPRRVRRDYTNKMSLTADPARQEIADSVADAVAQSFDLRDRPPQIGHK